MLNEKINQNRRQKEEEQILKFNHRLKKKHKAFQQKLEDYSKSKNLNKIFSK